MLSDILKEAESKDLSKIESIRKHPYFDKISDKEIKSLIKEFTLSINKKDIIRSKSIFRVILIKDGFVAQMAMD